MRRTAVVLAVSALVIAGGAIISTVAAQDLDLKAPRSSDGKMSLPPGKGGAAPDIDHPGGPEVPYTAGFISSLTAPTPTGRAGVAGWTAPNPPVGAEATGRREASGVFGIGFAVEWGRAPKPATSPAPPAQAATPPTPAAAPAQATAPAPPATTNPAPGMRSAQK
jgi:hypothetical protein